MKDIFMDCIIILISFQISWGQMQLQSIILRNAQEELLKISKTFLEHKEMCFLIYDRF